MNENVFLYPWLVSAKRLADGVEELADLKVRIKFDGCIETQHGHEPFAPATHTNVSLLTEDGYVVEDAKRVLDTAEAWLAYCGLPHGRYFDANRKRAGFVYQADAVSFAAKTGWDGRSLAITEHMSV
jgi:hypothetical protein